ncbi:MAG: ral stress protein [Paenibacillaceae bacterium]|jgi:bacillithiol system protein YtxJ|nr:ral stress protein [Paenibacillaceae bacterium]
MTQVHELAAPKDWKVLAEASAEKPVLLLKHSTRCPISAEAYDQFMKHVNKEPVAGMQYALVLVVEQRAISNAVAEELGVKHESPQVLLIKDGQVVWHTSHWRITADALKEQASKYR